MTNKTIYHVMDGHFDGTWSFYNDVIGSHLVTDWTVDTPGNSEITILAAPSFLFVPNIHLKIVEFYDNNADLPSITKLINSSNSGFCEFYMATNSVDTTFKFALKYSLNLGELGNTFYFMMNAVTHTFQLAVTNTTIPFTTNTWYRISVGWRVTGGAAPPVPYNDLAEGKCRCYINGVVKGDYNLNNNQAGNNLRFWTNRINITTYLDAIGLYSNGYTSYSIGSNQNLVNPIEFFNKCKEGIIHHEIEDSPWARFISTEKIYEGELVRIYDETVTQLFYGKVVIARDLGGVGASHQYEYECWGKAYSDLDEEPTIDYSASATDCATIALAAIDNVKSYITDDATSIPATSITCKPKSSQTDLKSLLTMALAWRSNAIWYLNNSDDKVYFRLTSNLISSGITIPTVGLKCRINIALKNSEFINRVVVSGANGINATPQTLADSIAQYGQRSWNGPKLFPWFYDQTEVDNVAHAILDCDKIQTPDAVKKCDVDLYEQNQVQVGQTISVQSNNFDALAIAKTLIIVETFHDLKINHVKIIATENILRLETGKDYYNEKITALEEGVINQGGDLPTKTVIVNGTYTGDGAGNAGDWGAYKEIDLSAYLSDILCVMLYRDNVADNATKSHFTCYKNDALGICMTHEITPKHIASAYLLHIVSGGKFQVGDKGSDSNPNKNGTVYVYVAWGVKA